MLVGPVVYLPNCAAVVGPEHNWLKTSFEYCLDERLKHSVAKSAVCRGGLSSSFLPLLGSMTQILIMVETNHGA